MTTTRHAYERASFAGDGRQRDELDIRLKARPSGPPRHNRAYDPSVPPTTCPACGCRVRMILVGTGASCPYCGWPEDGDPVAI